MADFDYDFFVIGGGSGGVRAARIAGRHGARVALAEDSRIGGTCVIRGCVPKKLMMYAARFRDAFEDSIGYGWSQGEPTFNWQTLIANKDREIDRLNAAYIRNLDRSGVEIFAERAVVTSPNGIRLAGGREISAGAILIATGGRPNRDTGLTGWEHAITSDEMFHLAALPRRILIVGAGYVAIEFASIMNGLGVETTIIHRGKEILGPFDADVRAAMRAAMERRGIAVHTEDQLIAIERTGTGLAATTQTGAVHEADQILMAIGRHPNARGIGLEEIGVAFDSDGSIAVDSRSRTSVPSIYAIGDVTNRINLTPVAIREGHVLADNLFGGADLVVDHNDIPHAVFGIPEIGAVGMSEEAAIAEFPSVDIYQSTFRPMRHDLSGRDEKMTLKLVVDAESERILGCHIIGEDAAELIQLMAVIVKLRATKAQLDSTMALHPTAAEEIVTMREPARRHRKSPS